MGGGPRQLAAAVRSALLVPFLLAPGELYADAQLVLRSHEVRFLEDAVAVELRLKNEGDKSADSVFASGTLFGTRVEAELAPIAAGAESLATFRFARGAPRPGRFALALAVEWRPQEPAEAAPRLLRRVVLVDRGAPPPAAVRVAVTAEPLDVAGDVAIVLESLDAAPHRVRLEVFPPEGVNVWEPPGEVEVPAAGSVAARARVLRGNAARGTRQAFSVVASPIDGDRQRDVVAEGTLVLANDPAVLPRLRVPLAILGILLLLASGLLEWRAHRSRPGSAGDAPPKG